MPVAPLPPDQKCLQTLPCVPCWAKRLAEKHCHRAAGEAGLDAMPPAGDGQLALGWEGAGEGAGGGRLEVRSGRRLGV